MKHRFVNDCLDCEWSASTGKYTRTELSDRTIEHAVETGHDVTGKRLQDDQDGHTIDRPLTQAGQEPSGNGRIESDRTAGDHQRVYQVNNDFLDRLDDGSGDDDTSDDRDRTDEKTGAITRGDFEAELRRLVRRAHRSGVPIDGCDVRFPDVEIPDYTIEIHELRDIP